MPRYSLYCLPLMNTISPGLYSSHPRGGLPRGVTVSAPAAMALAMSPDICQPAVTDHRHPAGRAAAAS